MSEKKQETGRRGWAWLDGWAGRTRHAVLVLGTCTRRGRPHYKVRFLESAYRYRPGQILYPPAWAVTFDNETPH